jgi:hypothetical protein
MLLVSANNYLRGKTTMIKPQPEHTNGSSIKTKKLTDDRDLKKGNDDDKESYRYSSTRWTPAATFSPIFL